MTTETMREAVARAVRKFASAPEADTLTAAQFILNREDAIADAAIRTVLERLREPSDNMIDAAIESFAAPKDSELLALIKSSRVRLWQAMLDAAVREVG